MKQALRIVLLFIFLCKIINTDAWNPPTGGIGAVYTMSNGPKMNQILIQRLNSTGQLAVAGRINTNGTGVNTAQANVLYSQGPLTVYSTYLFAVNPGSNTLSMFIIDPLDATQLKLIAVQPTFGQFPVSVDVNNKYACVLTGGTITGIRCYTYDASGLYVVSSFDRNLTSYISQTIPPNGPANTMSDIAFSADNLALIIAVKGVDSTKPGYLLFFFFDDSYTTLSSTPVQVTPTGAIQPFSLTLVGSNGLLIPDPQSNGVITLNYSSTDGTISNSLFTPVNPSVAPSLSWSTYSPTIGNYYVIDETGDIIELNINLGSSTNSVRIVQYYQVSSTTGASHATVVTIRGIDYLYVIGDTGYVMYGYRLNVPGHATLKTVSVLQSGNTLNLPQLTGMAAFVQAQYRAAIVNPLAASMNVNASKPATL